MSHLPACFGRDLHIHRHIVISEPACVQDRHTLVLDAENLARLRAWMDFKLYRSMDRLNWNGGAKNGVGDSY